MPRGKLTLKSVAKALNVSTATISNAFGRPDQLSAKKREEILKACAEMGYFGPNKAARSLRRGHFNIVALILPDSLEYMVTDPVASQFMKGVAEAINESDTNLLLFSGSNDSVNDVMDFVDGFICYGAPRNSKLLEQLAQIQKQVVTVDFDIPDKPSVNIDNQEAAYHVAKIALAHNAFRDAWAVGVTPEYVVGVWAGNADGVGRPGLVGISAAGPLLFDVFNLLPTTTWFDKPNSNLINLATCRQSGYRMGPHCTEADTIAAPPTATRMDVCPWHERVHLDATQKYRVHSDCESVSSMVHRSWFVLPPAMEWYYQQTSGDYHSLPPWRADCATGQLSGLATMEVIYPKQDAELYIPTELDGSPGQVIFEVAHRRRQAEIHWHLDDTYLGTTQQFHSLEMHPAPGRHLLTLVDDQGELLIHPFEVLSKEDRAR